MTKTPRAKWDLMGYKSTSTIFSLERICPYPLESIWVVVKSVIGNKTHAKIYSKKNNTWK